MQIQKVLIHLVWLIDGESALYLISLSFFSVILKYSKTFCYKLKCIDSFLQGLFVGKL